MILGVPCSASAQIPDSTIAIVPRVLPAPVCLRDSSESFHRAETGRIGPSPRSLMAPDLRGRTTRGGELTVRSHVTAHGVVDSVVMTGVGDRAFREAVREMAFKARYRPARRDGCLVDEWFQVTVKYPADR
jgi:TonB family protein